MGNNNPLDLFNGVTIDFGIFPYAVLAFAVIVLLLAVFAVIALFRQKAALHAIEINLSQINSTLLRQAVGPISAQPAPAQNVCPKCAAVYPPGTAFCQKCGSPL